MTTIEMVEEFHNRAGHSIPDKISIDDVSINNFRVKLIGEEFIELVTALANKDKIEIFDALLDLQYVLDGTFLQLGYGKIKQTGFEEIHRSNVSKDFGSKGINIPHKITKGDKYSPPDLCLVLSMAQQKT